MTEELRVGERTSTLVDELLELAGEVPGETFEVTVGKQKLYFRLPRNSDEIDCFIKGGLDFLEQMTNPAKKKLKSHEDLAKNLAPADFVRVWQLHFWAAKENEFTVPEAMRLCAAPKLVYTICNLIDLKHRVNARVTLSEAVDTQKKGSKRTGSLGSSSVSQETSTAATPKSSRRRRSATSRTSSP